MLQSSVAAGVETKLFLGFSCKRNQINMQVHDILGLALAGKIHILLNMVT